ncbi:2-keto-4-pentenoate hydratase [Pseudomonas matsuisoli]|uniref:Fumarylacetoacetate (FAA) hydrolase n=1 Tax=Pseudomonas matsuisoli TaxID=1515666 RepID=A0A917PZD9_9PSED|nr:hydratase [Pseudomonas matsuisoli]GGK01557.1 fumarylacetoacetate (FAA) hydrolase [Pseudomonas matsuisoli]
MPTLPFDPAAPATLLLDAWKTGDLLNALSEALRPETLEQGYDVQDAFFKAAGGARGGWKLGVGSPAAMRGAGLSRPLVGQLDKARIHASGAHLSLPSPTTLTIECEIAFTLARDLPPQPGREIQPYDIRATCLTFEVVRSRFVDRKTVGWPSFTGDNVGFEALVVGANACAGLDREVLRTLAETAVVHLDGAPKAKGLFGETATDPLNSLAELYAHAAERGETLRAGDIVSSGAMCEPFDIEGAGHTLSVRYFGHELTFSL